MSTTLEQLEAQARQRATERSGLTGAVQEYVLSHPGCSHGEVSLSTGVPVTKLARACGPVMARVLRHDDADWAGEISDAQLINALLAVSSRLQRVPSSALYTAERTSGEPSASKLTTRFGSWAAAIQVAGLEVTSASTETSTQQLFEVVRRFTLTGETSQSAYTRWAKENDAPSLSWILVKMGSWTDLIERTRGIS